MSVCTHWTRVGTSKAFTSSCLVGPVRRSASVVCNAKKKGKKGGKKQKGSLLDIPKKSQIQPWQTTEIIMQHLLLVESYRRAAGKPLMENVEIDKVADAIYEAPFVVMAHNRFSEGVKDEDAVFTYGNKAALDAFQADEFGDFAGALSSFCVAGLMTETVDTREGNLKRLVEGLSTPEATPDEAGGAAEQGAESSAAEEDALGSDEERERRVGAAWDAEIINGTGWRIGLKGRKIYIEFELFNIFSPTGAVVGQAATFSEYRLEDGTVVKFAQGGKGVPLPSAEDIAAAERAVAEQSEAVRKLKETEGKANSDPDVKGAVAELISRKERVQALKDAAEEAAEEAPPVTV